MFSCLRAWMRTRPLVTSLLNIVLLFMSHSFGRSTGLIRFRAFFFLFHALACFGLFGYYTYTYKSAMPIASCFVLFDFMEFI